LLSWVKQRTEGYGNVFVRDFSSHSWDDGLAFCALLDSYSPNSIDFKSLHKINKTANLKLAFEMGARLGIPKLLEEEDLKDPETDIITYVSSMYDTLEKGQDNVALKRESQQSKEKLKNVQNELHNLRSKLQASKQAMRDKEIAKNKLEQRVQALKVMLNSEKKSTEEADAEYERKRKVLEKKIEEATGIGR